MNENENGIFETGDLIKQTERHMKKFFHGFSGFKTKQSNCSNIEELKLYLIREKSIYHGLNMLEHQKTAFIGKVWIPEDKVQLA
mmetsp:Transcript_11773/g.16551  ORF Transcript_11773/g.16551 Transcript_11773/m.16551 type:complete len:84 (-) Transcript_11773:1675-1926(-)